MSRFNTLLAVLVVSAGAIASGQASVAVDPQSAMVMLGPCRDLSQLPPVTQQRSSPVEMGECAGIIDTIIYFDASICTPTGSTFKQGALVVVDYLSKRPARLHENFKDLALEALRAAWPCRSASRADPLAAKGARP